MSNSDPDTTPLQKSYLEIVEIDGREYQRLSIERHIHLVPVDDHELERLELQHRVLSEVFDQRLLFPPIPNPSRILDCGYGSGAWAVEVAENYPNCEVIGVDISSHMKPDETPSNLELQVDNLNQPFTFPNDHFDLVHSRLVVNGIDLPRWNSYIRDIVRVLKPGGWLQMVEVYHNVQSDNGTLTDLHALRLWSASYRRSLGDIKDLRVPMRMNAMMTSAGMIDVDMKMIPFPLSAWPGDPRDRHIGQINRNNAHALLSSLALYPFTQRLNMSLEEFQGLIARARSEVDDLSLKAYFPLEEAGRVR